MKFDLMKSANDSGPGGCRTQAMSSCTRQEQSVGGEFTTCSANDTRLAHCELMLPWFRRGRAPGSKHVIRRLRRNLQHSRECTFFDAWGMPMVVVAALSGGRDRPWQLRWGMLEIEGDAADDFAQKGQVVSYGFSASLVQPGWSHWQTSSVRFFAS
jgi:hypothetical protein